MGLKQLVILMIAVLLPFSGCSSVGKERRITVDEYRDRMKAGWIGQMAGVGWGGPTEFKWMGEIIPSKEIPSWNPEMINQFQQDDLYVEMTFLRTLEQHGLDVDIRRAGIDFANSRYRLWHANLAGRKNLRSGIAPPWSGHPRFNRHADDIDYQIEADYAGLISPGMPQRAIELGNTFGRIMNYGDGLYGGNFVAGMYCEAFFETDPEKIILAGLKCIPPESMYAKAIRDVLLWARQFPDDWTKTWERVNHKYHKNPDFRLFSCSDPGDDFNIDAKINGAFIAIGLLYGQGNPDKTITIATRCGQDSDCNPSNAAGILFTSLGADAIPAKFTSALDPDPVFSFTEYNFPRLLEVCETLARESVVKAGGRIEKDENGKEIFVIPLERPEPGPLEQCWEPGPVEENIRFSEEEMSSIIEREDEPGAEN